MDLNKDEYVQMEFNEGIDAKLIELSESESLEEKWKEYEIVMTCTMREIIGTEECKILNDEKDKPIQDQK